MTERQTNAQGIPRNLLIWKKILQEVWKDVIATDRKGRIAYVLWLDSEDSITFYQYFNIGTSSRRTMSSEKKAL